MAANPRKFSEKIALMRAKEAEADAAFHQILNEVSGITKTSDTQIPPYAGLKNLIPHGSAPYAPFKTGSLPNINHSLQQQIQQQNVQRRQCSPSQQMLSHGSVPAPGAAIDLKSAIHDLNSLHAGDANRRRFMPPQYGPGPNSPGLRPQRNRTSDHVTYSPYLTPHPLNGPEWKKFKSDSDIHGSIKQQTPTSSNGGSASSGIISPMIHRRVLEVGGNPGNAGNPMALDMRSSGTNTAGNGAPAGNNSAPAKYVDGSGYSPMNGMPPIHLSMGMPGLAPPQSVGMSQPPQQHHGSLPDLSNLGFSNSPIQGHSNSPNPGLCSPPNDGYGRMVSTSMPPPDSPSSIRPNGSRQQSPLVGSPTQMQGVPYPFPYFPQQLPMHMSAPLPIGQASPQPGGLLSSANPLSHSIPLGQQQQQPSHQQHNKPPTSLDKQIVNETIRRRISDKMLAQQQAHQQYRQSTEKNVPSPSSPGTPPVRSPESCPPTNQHTAGGTNDSNISYALSPGSHSSLQQQFDQVTMDSSSSGGNHFTNGNPHDSPFIHDHRHPMKQHSIPNIVLTGVDDNCYGQYFDKDFRPLMSTSLSFDDVFNSDEQFKNELTPLDFEGLQMLEDPTNVLADPSTEEQLRLCG